MENLLQNIASVLWIVLGVYFFFGLRKWSKRFSELYDELKEKISAPVVHGRWMPFDIEAADDIQYCSVCEIGFGAKTDYCPHCGAKMDIWKDEVNSWTDELGKSCQDCMTILSKH